MHRYIARAGLQLLQKLDVVFGNRWLNDSLTPVNLDPSEWFRDVSREKAAIHLALRQLVLTPDALALEIERESSRDKGKRNRR